MSVKLRKISKHKPCRVCGADMKGQYGREVGLIVTIVLCKECTEIYRDKIFKLPSEIELMPKMLTFAPLALERGTK